MTAANREQISSANASPHPEWRDGFLHDLAALENMPRASSICPTTLSAVFVEKKHGPIILMEESAARSWASQSEGSC
jgi:hypothetical protein